MNDINRLNKVGAPFLAKEGKTGVWKVCFKYADNNNKQKKYYYSEGLNDSSFFAYDTDGKKKMLKGVAVLKNLTTRKALAQKRIDRLEQDLNNYVFDVNKGVFTLGDDDKPLTDLMQEYITFKKTEGITAGTIADYNSKINGLNKWLGITGKHNINVKEFTKQDLHDFYSYLLDELGYSKKYRDAYNKFFTAVYNWLIKFKDMDVDNITTTFKNIHKGVTKMHRAIDVKDLKKMMEEISETRPRLALMFQFVFFTLHRIETLVNVQRRDVDLDNRLIYLSSDIVKNNQQVTITIADPLYYILKDYIDNNDTAPTDYLFGKGKGLFSSRKNTANSFSNTFAFYKKNAIERGSIYFDEYTTLYSAKHSGVKFLLDSGLSPEQIISITGHTNVKALGVYAKDYKPDKIKFPPIPTF